MSFSSTTPPPPPSLSTTPSPPSKTPSTASPTTSWYPFPPPFLLSTLPSLPLTHHHCAGRRRCSSRLHPWPRRPFTRQNRLHVPHADIHRRRRQLFDKSHRKTPHQCWYFTPHAQGSVSLDSFQCVLFSFYIYCLGCAVLFDRSVSMRKITWIIAIMPRDVYTFV